MRLVTRALTPQTPIVLQAGGGLRATLVSLNKNVHVLLNLCAAPLSQDGPHAELPSDASPEGSASGLDAFFEHNGLLAVLVPSLASLQSCVTLFSLARARHGSLGRLRISLLLSDRTNTIAQTLFPDFHERVSGALAQFGVCPRVVAEHQPTSEGGARVLAFACRDTVIPGRPPRADELCCSGATNWAVGLGAEAAVALWRPVVDSAHLAGDMLVARAALQVPDSSTVNVICPADYPCTRDAFLRRVADVLRGVDPLASAGALEFALDDLPLLAAALAQTLGRTDTRVDAPLVPYRPTDDDVARPPPDALGSCEDAIPFSAPRVAAFPKTLGGALLRISSSAKQESAASDGKGERGASEEEEPDSRLHTLVMNARALNILTFDEVPGCLQFLLVDTRGASEGTPFSCNVQSALRTAHDEDFLRLFNFVDENVALDTGLCDGPLVLPPVPGGDVLSGMFGGHIIQDGPILDAPVRLYSPTFRVPPIDAALRLLAPSIRGAVTTEQHGAHVTVRADGLTLHFPDVHNEDEPRILIEAAPDVPQAGLDELRRRLGLAPVDLPAHMAPKE